MTGTCVGGYFYLCSVQGPLFGAIRYIFDVIFYKHTIVLLCQNAQ